MSAVGHAKERIRAAFAEVPPPPSWSLVNSTEGEEPALLARELEGVDDWRTLDAAYLDAAPDGYGSALSFLSDEAFRFFLPAFLLADLDEALLRVTPVFHLTHGLTEADRDQPINPLRYGARTWHDHALHRFSLFSAEQAAAIAAYLEVIRDRDEIEAGRIEQALGGYWRERAQEAR